MQLYFQVIKKGLTAAVMWATFLGLSGATAFVYGAESDSRQVSWQQLQKEYKDYMAGLSALVKRKDFDPVKHRAKTQGFVVRAIQLYRQDPRDKVAYDAMRYVLSYDVHNKRYEEVCRNLRAYHLRRPDLNLALAVEPPLTVFSDECEQLFNEAIVSGVNQRVRDTAKITLAAIYREMATFLANISDLKLSPARYLTSEVQASFERLPESTLLRISRQMHNRSWLNRDWKVVRGRALELVKALDKSSQPLVHYYFGKEGEQRDNGASIKDVAKRVRFQLENATPGARMRDFGAKDLKGNSVSFADHKGKVVVLDIWATWCKPCVKELPYWRALHKQMRGRPFELVTLSIDSRLSDVKRFMRRHSMPFTNWYIGEDQEFLSKWPTYPLPKVFVIDHQGVIRSIPRVGHQDLNRYLERLVVAAESATGR